MDTAALIVSLIFIPPYLGWGIYVLRLRYRRHEELPPAVEVGTLAAVIIFYIVELALLKSVAVRMPVYGITAMLGLLVSGIALYGPMVASLISQLAADTLLPQQNVNTGQPCYLAAEDMEKCGDYQGAAREYIALTRLFPDLPAPKIRVAENYMKMAQPERAVDWFEKGVEQIDSPEKNILVVNRLADIYLRDLDRPDEAIRVLESFLERFPAAGYAESVRRRISELK